MGTTDITIPAQRCPARSASPSSRLAQRSTWRCVSRTERATPLLTPAVRLCRRRKRGSPSSALQATTDKSRAAATGTAPRRRRLARLGVEDAGDARGCRRRKRFQLATAQTSRTRRRRDQASRLRAGRTSWRACGGGYDASSTTWCTASAPRYERAVRDPQPTAPAHGPRLLLPPRPPSVCAAAEVCRQFAREDLAVVAEPPSPRHGRRRDRGCGWSSLRPADAAKARRRPLAGPPPPREAPLDLPENVRGPAADARRRRRGPGHADRRRRRRRLRPRTASRAAPAAGGPARGGCLPRSARGAVQRSSAQRCPGRRRRASTLSRRRRRSRPGERRTVASRRRRRPEGRVPPKPPPVAGADAAAARGRRRSAAGGRRGRPPRRRRRRRRWRRRGSPPGARDAPRAAGAARVTCGGTVRGAVRGDVCGGCCGW